MKHGRRDFLKKASLGVVGTAIAAVGIKEVEASSTEIVEIDIPEDLAECCDFNFFEQTEVDTTYLPTHSEERIGFGDELVEITIQGRIKKIYDYTELILNSSFEDHSPDRMRLFNTKYFSDKIKKTSYGLCGEIQYTCVTRDYNEGFIEVQGYLIDGSIPVQQEPVVWMLEWQGKMYYIETDDYSINIVDDIKEIMTKGNLNIDPKTYIELNIC